MIGYNHVMDYKVEVRYNRDNAYEGTYENYLPSDLIYTLKTKKLQQDADGSDAAHWTGDADSQPQYTPQYSWQIPYSVDKATVEPKGKYDRQEYLKAWAGRLRDSIGNVQEIQQAAGAIGSLGLYTEVGQRVARQTGIRETLQKVERDRDQYLVRQIRERWTDDYLKEWKENAFADIDVEVDGSGDPSRQLGRFYEMLDEEPLRMDLSHDALILEALSLCQLHMSNGQFPEDVLSHVLMTVKKAIDGLGERIALAQESRQSMTF